MKARRPAENAGALGPSGTTAPPQKNTQYDYGLGTTTSHPMTGFYIHYQGRWRNVTELLRSGARFVEDNGVIPTIYRFSGGHNLGPYDATVVLV